MVRTVFCIFQLDLRSIFFLYLKGGKHGFHSLVIFSFRMSVYREGKSNQIHHTEYTTEPEEAYPPFWKRVVKLCDSVKTMIDKDIFFFRGRLLFECRIPKFLIIRNIFLC